MNMLSFVISTSFLFFCRDPGGVLYGPGLSCGFCLPPFQDPQGRVPGSAGSLSRSPVSSEVGTARVGFMVYDYFVTVDAFIFFPLSLFCSTSFLQHFLFPVISCEWIPRMQMLCTSEACVCTTRTASTKLYSSLSRLCAWHPTTKKPG